MVPERSENILFRTGLLSPLILRGKDLGLEKVMHGITIKCLGLALIAGLPFAAPAAKKIPMSNARYSGTAIVASGSSVAITARTFDPEPQRWSSLAASPGAFASVSGNVKEQFLFMASDQQELASILHAELIRLGIFQVVSDESLDVVEVQLHFISGAYKQAINEYELSLEMTLLNSADQRFTKHYVLNSNEKSSGWKKLNTSVWKGKMQLAQVALDTLIPDIERFLAEK
jgi:hypothetical protein